MTCANSWYTMAAAMTGRIKSNYIKNFLRKAVAYDYPNLHLLISRFIKAERDWEFFISGFAQV